MESLIFFFFNFLMISGDEESAKVMNSLNIISLHIRSTFKLSSAHIFK